MPTRPGASPDRIITTYTAAQHEASRAHRRACHRGRAADGDRFRRSLLPRRVLLSRLHPPHGWGTSTSRRSPSPSSGLYAISPSTEEKKELRRLPRFFADLQGWEAFAVQDGRGPPGPE